MEISNKTIIWVLLIITLTSMITMKVNAAKSPVVAAVVVAEEAAGPGTAEAAATDCVTQLLNMSDCLGYVEQGSNLTEPEKSCCPELAGVLDSKPICLCQLFAKSKDFGVQIDVKRAFMLSSYCKVQTPDISLCSAVGVPVGAPGGAPTSSELPMEGDATTGGMNGASSNAQFNVVAYLVAGLAMTFTLFKL